MMTNDAFDAMLTRLGVHPVLIDIGASGSPPQIWDEIARHSIYVGFDPDRRDLHEVSDGKFFRSYIINKAVTYEKTKEVRLYLTRSPYCSSTLKPDMGSLSDYLYSDLFRVKRELTVPAITLGEALETLSLDRVHWFKTDAQGIDLQLFNSLPAEIRSRVLAVDVEPGLIDAYVGEDLFVDVHQSLTECGFWLSNLNVKGSVRMRASSVHQMDRFGASLSKEQLLRFLRRAPGWGEARYLRSLDWLEKMGESLEDYLLLWGFALIDNQPGFAFDVALDYEEHFGSGPVSDEMAQTAVQTIHTSVQQVAPRSSLFRRIGRRVAGILD